MTLNFSLLLSSVLVLSKYTSNNLHKQDINTVWNYLMIFPADSLGYEIDSAAGTLRIRTEKERASVSQRERVWFSVCWLLLTDAVWCLYVQDRCSALNRTWHKPGHHVGCFLALPRPSATHKHKHTCTERHKYWSTGKRRRRSKQAERRACKDWLSKLNDTYTQLPSTLNARMDFQFILWWY